MSHHANYERLLVLIPAFNEQEAIPHVVKSIHAAVPEADVLVVDDGSDDNTAQEAVAAGAIVLRHPFNLGIGGAVQTGLRFAQQEDYDIVVRMDGDGQHNPSDILPISAALKAKQVDVVIGSRFLGQKSTMHIPLLRRLGIRIFAVSVSLLTRQWATDTTSGLFGLNRRAVSLLVTYMPQDYPEVESRVIFHKARLSTLELPVKMRPRLSGVSSINFWCTIYYAFKVLVAVFITAFKDIPPLSKEMPHVYTNRAESYGPYPQHYAVVGDRPTDPQV